MPEFDIDSALQSYDGPTFVIVRRADAPWASPGEEEFLLAWQPSYLDTPQEASSFYTEDLANARCLQANAKNKVKPYPGPAECEYDCWFWDWPY